MAQPPTHANLVDRAARWLETRGRCKIVLAGVDCGVGEIPDAIGFRSGGYSLLVECKVSVKDFQRDLTKLTRVRSELGMGAKRYYLCPPDTIPVDQLPSGWGLLHAEPSGRVRVIVQAPLGGDRRGKGGQRAEAALLVCCLRRCQLRLPEGTTIRKHIAIDSRPPRRRRRPRRNGFGGLIGFPTPVTAIDGVITEQTSA